MIGLDFTKMDDTLIAFISDYVKINQFVEKIYFIHIEKNLELPTEVKELMVAPLDEEVKEKMTELVDKRFKNKGNIEVSYQVAEGQPLVEMLHWANIKQVDLVIVGKKSEEDGNGVVPQMFARKGKTSMLFVPENYSGNISKILVPLDFSEHAEIALNQAIEMASKISGATIICQHVFSLPTGYTKAGKTKEEMEAIMEKYAKIDYEKFIAKIDTKGVKIQPIFVVSHYHSISKNIINQAKESQVDFIIMGSKGQNATAILLLGSVTENLIKYNIDIPLMVVKKEGENIGFWEAMMKI